MTNTRHKLARYGVSLAIVLAVHAGLLLLWTRNSSVEHVIKRYDLRLVFLTPPPVSAQATAKRPSPSRSSQNNSPQETAQQGPITLPAMAQVQVPAAQAPASRPSSSEPERGRAWGRASSLDASR